MSSCSGSSMIVGRLREAGGVGIFLSFSFRLIRRSFPILATKLKIFEPSSD